uniref:Secreted lipase-like protein 1 n=1 Tax=Mayetiola destructor TaxID=39758 RepID=B5AXG3_MAYDE|nr:secreted lipase-like protein 1 [Mayetiola destructor]
MLGIKLFFVVVFFVGLNGQNEYRKPFKLSCFTSRAQEEFKFYWLDDDINNFRQRDLEIEFGNKSSFLFFFVGFGDTVSMERVGDNYYMAKEIVNAASGQVVCFCDYLFGIDGDYAQYIQYYDGIKLRVPYVIETLTNFIGRLKKFALIKSANQITAAGFCLGGHMAGMLGRDVEYLFGEKIRMVLAFDPPKYGFERNSLMFRERVQKGDAKYVEVTHTSFIGMYTNDADTDLILNNLRQPGCPHDFVDLFCNHNAALFFHQHIFMHTKPAPFLASKDKNKPRDGDVLIGFWNTDYSAKGVVYLETDDFIGFEENSMVQRILDKVGC